MTLLTDKAKGKQRALDVHNSQPLPVTVPTNEPPTRNLVVRFTEGIPDLLIAVDKKDTVRDVKRNIRQARTQLQDRRLRLIHSGRLLTDGTILYLWLVSLEEHQKRANADMEVEATTTAPTTWLHCSVGPKIEPWEEEETKEQTAQLQPARGFDRLSSIGFSETDIAQFRQQFHSQASRDPRDFDTDEEYDEHARALEEQWIDSLDNVGTASLSQASSPSNSAVLQGILMGFFFPLLPFFIMRHQKPPVFWDDETEYEAPPNVIFSQQMQMGLVVGFLVNVLFGLWRFLLESS